MATNELRPPVQPSRAISAKELEAIVGPACVITRVPFPSALTVAIEDGSLSFDFLDVVAANAACFKLLGVAELLAVPPQLIELPPLVWLACDRSLAKGDTAGHLAVALPADLGSIKISACTWQGSQASSLLEWERPLHAPPVAPLAPLLPSGPVADGPMSPPQHPVSSAADKDRTPGPNPMSLRALELINDERFPAALT